MYHYLEIKHYKNQETDYTNKLVELLADRIEVLWVLTNPEAGKKLLNDKIKVMREGKEIDGITPNNFKEVWTKMLKHLPQTFKLPDSTKKSKQFFPHFDKKELRERLRSRGVGIRIKE